MAKRAIRELKKEDPVHLATLLCPYLPTERNIHVPEGFNGTFYSEGQEFVPRKLAIIHANRYMIKHCDILIAYAPIAFGNSRKFLEYAKKQPFIRQIIDLTDHSDADIPNM